MNFELELVCDGCFDDSGILAFIDKNSLTGQCSFCGANSSTARVAAFDQIVEHIETSLYQEFDDAANWLYHENSDGGYIGENFDTYELLFNVVEIELSLIGGDEIMGRLVAKLPQHLWCEKDPFGLNDFEVARFSWSHFCNVVKYRQRYFFSNYLNVPDREIYSPATTLEKIFEYAENYGLFVTLQSETQLFRARYQECGVQLQSAQDLGPPPEEKAIRANRMSPAGVSMFYAGEGEETAIRETADGPGPFVLGIFETKRPAVILDLTKIPPVPSIFEEIPETMEFRPRQVLGFLNHVVDEMSRPIERDDRVHIEYVPTQVVTEFIRSQVLFGGTPIDGIKYPSAVHPGRSCYVLFANQDNLLPRPETTGSHWGPTSEDRWLKLTNVNLHLVSQDDIDQWND